MTTTDECEAVVKPSNRSKLLAATAAVALSGAVLAATQAAHADNVPMTAASPLMPFIAMPGVTCSTGSLCLYTDRGNAVTGGTGIDITEGLGRVDSLQVDGYRDYDNALVWVHNNTSSAWCLADYPNLEQARATVGPGEDHDLSQIGFTVSSARIGAC